MNAFTQRFGSTVPGQVAAPPLASVPPTGRAAGMFSNLTNPTNAPVAQGAEGGTKTPKPKANFWVNLGYPVSVQDMAGEVETRFVSLPMGMPLDTQEKLPITGKNVNYIAFQTARNSLLDYVVESFSDMVPGEERIMPIGDTGLFLQVRRVNDDTTVPVVDSASNPFMKALNLGGKIAA